MSTDTRLRSSEPVTPVTGRGTVPRRSSCPGAGTRYSVTVSSDGNTWQTVLTGAEFAEAEGTEDYDSPVVLNLKGVVARMIRFQNLVPWNTKGNIGLSKVIFRAPAESAAR